MQHVVAACGFGAILLGAGLTCLGFLLPRHVSALEFAGGVLVIAGLAAIGRELATAHVFSR